MSEQVNNSKNQKGATAREVCIHIARELSTLVKHTLGPNGLDNMLVDTAETLLSPMTVPRLSNSLQSTTLLPKSS